MKYIINIALLCLLLVACEKEQEVILDLRISPEDITKIELRADHKTLLANGVAQMGFHTVVYATKKITNYVRNKDKTFSTITSDSTFVVPNDQVPEGFVKVYDPSGKELVNSTFATTNTAPGTVLKFYAKGGDIKSNELPITIRETPDESYDELIVPVIFHMLLPPASSGPSYDIGSEYLEEQLKRVSDIYNRRMTTDPNGGNVKITFKLALYNKDGVKLQEPGKNIYNLNSTDMATVTTSPTAKKLNTVIVARKSTIIWDPNKYLNIWLTKFPSGTAYSVSTPHIMHSDYDLASILGLGNIATKDEFTVADVTDCTQAGIMVNYMTFLNPNIQGQNTFTLATAIAGYYGVLETDCNKYGDLQSRDDYCADTYNYNYDYYPTVYKANNLKGQPENDPTRPLEYFTSFNVMDIYSKKNSVSVDQTIRIRKVMTQCPSRWHYKSDFAFTGKD